MKTIRIIVCLISISLAAFSQEKETLRINWPQQYNWKVISEDHEGTLTTINRIPGTQTAEKWNILASTARNDGERFAPMEIAMNNIFNQSHIKFPKCTIALLERDKDAKNHWIIFKIEGVSNDKTPESRLYYIIQGNSNLYTNYIAVKEKNLSDEFVKTWQDIFKSSELSQGTSPAGQ